MDNCIVFVQCQFFLLLTYVNYMGKTCCHLFRISLSKHVVHGIGGQLIKWIESWLCGRTQTVVVNGTQSSPVIVTSGVPQGTVLGPLMFLLYINDIGLQITSELGLFADDSVLYGVGNNMISSAEVLQSDLNKLVVWSEKWQMAFNASKCLLQLYFNGTAHNISHTTQVSVCRIRYIAN